MTTIDPTHAATRRLLPALSLTLTLAAVAGAAEAAEPAGFLERLHHRTTLASTVPANGDQNPYAIVVAPITAGPIERGDVLVDNFNDKGNLQGLGSTIVAISPIGRKTKLVAEIPRQLPGCPGGVGLTTAMTMLKSGWLIVGSLPSSDGTTATKGQGCLIVLDPHGAVAATIAGPDIDGPWGNMAVIDNGATASLFVSNTGTDVGGPEDASPVVNKATVLRIDLKIAAGKPPVVASQTVIGSGFGSRADKDVFIIGPTGLALDRNGTLYVSDAVENRIVAIPDAERRTDSAGIGHEITRDGLLKRPLAMAVAANGHLLVTNGLNGQAVEIDPAEGRQVYALWLDTNKAQDPPGSGDLFGIAVTPTGDGIYYVEDEVNTLVLAH